MSQNLPSLPFEISVMILGQLLKHNPGTYVVFCQSNVVSPLESFEFNTFNRAFEQYNICTGQGGSSAIYERRDGRFVWLDNYLHTTFGNFIGNINDFLAGRIAW